MHQRELDSARKGSPLVPSPASRKGAPLYQLNTISLKLSQGEIYTLQYPAFPGCHLSERRVTGLGLASCYLLRGRLRALFSFPGSCISLGSWWHCFCEVTFPQPNFSVSFPTCSTSSPELHCLIHGVTAQKCRSMT